MRAGLRRRAGHPASRQPPRGVPHRGRVLLLPGLESAAIQQIVSGLGLQAIWHPQRIVPSPGPLEIETRTVEPSPSIAWILKDVETTLRPLLRQLANAQVGLVMGGGGALF